MELDYEDLRVLPDAEEATADDDIVVLDACSLAIWTSSPAGINDDDITNTQETLDEGIKGKKSSGPQDGTVSHNPVTLATNMVPKSASDHISGAKHLGSFETILHCILMP